MIRSCFSFACCCACLLLGGCDPTTDQDPQAGVAPNDNEPGPAQPAAEPEPQPEPALDAEPTPAVEGERQSVPGMSYVLPEGWSVGPARQMRLLTLMPVEFEGAELAIARWPGDVGGFKPNIGRWAMQAGIDHDVLNRTAYPQIDVGDTQAAYLPLVNKDDNRAILAVWVPRGADPDQPDETWTFKLTCSAEQAIKLEPQLKAWAGSVVFE